MSFELLKFLVQPEPWMDFTNCRGADPNLFQLDQGENASRPRAEACDNCVVTEECYDYGYRTESVGVWGGRVLTLQHGRKPRPQVADVVPFQRLVADSTPQPVATPKRRRTATKTTQQPTKIAASKSRRGRAS